MVAGGAMAAPAAALRAVLARAGMAAERSGRAAEAVRVVAVGKTKPVSMLRQLYDAGHRCFGENYVQEFVTKAPQVLILSPARLRRSLFNFALAEHPSRGNGVK